MASSPTVITNTTPLINFAEIGRLDDVAARTIAFRHGLRVMGTIGCLRLAKDRGLIPAIAPLLDQLQTNARFWISSSLRTRVLRDAGEIVEEG